MPLKWVTMQMYCQRMINSEGFSTSFFQWDHFVSSIMLAFRLSPYWKGFYSKKRESLYYNSFHFSRPLSIRERKMFFYKVPPFQGIFVLLNYDIFLSLYVFRLLRSVKARISVLEPYHIQKWLLGKLSVISDNWYKIGNKISFPIQFQY